MTSRWSVRVNAGIVRQMTELAPLENAGSRDGLLSPFQQRNLARNRRALTYRRRRLFNGTVLAAGSSFAWLVMAALARWITPHVHGAPLSWLTWTILLPLYLTLMYGGKLLPGWGLGIVSELRYTVLLTGVMGALADLTQVAQRPSLGSLIPGVLIVLLGIPLQLLVRSLVKTLLLRRDLWGVPVVIYGAARTGERIVQALQTEAGLGYRPVALFDDNPALHGTTVLGVPVIGDTSESLYEAPVAILAMPGAARGTYTALLDGPLSAYRTVIVIPDLFDIQTLWARARDLGGVMGIQISQQLADPIARRSKRLLSLVAVIGTFPFWALLCGIVALLIWLEDRHTPIFLQERIGLGGQRFDTWKFRTMVPDAEEVLKLRLANDPALRAEWEQNFKLRNDPRITRIGKILRKTSLDELPQLVNVLRGDMALVGPRPLPLYHHQQLPLEVQQLRHEVRPGMTGLWQVSGRSDAGNEGMIQLDPYYVRNWSIWLDAVILLRTFRAVLKSAGAY